MDSLTVPAKNTGLIILLEGLCFSRCVFGTIFVCYLAHPSSCHPLGIALQSVINVYWWPCVQEVGFKFTQVNRPLDRKWGRMRKTHIFSKWHLQLSISRVVGFSHMLHPLTNFFLLSSLSYFRMSLRKHYGHWSCKFEQNLYSNTLLT